MPKRTNKAIKPYVKKDGKTYYKFQTYLGKDDNGKSVLITRQGFTSYNEANDEFEHLRSKGASSYTKKKQIKLSEIWELWFQNYKKQVKESSANKTKQVYKNHVEPNFGDKYLDQIKPAPLQKWIDKKSEEIVKYMDAYNILNNLLKYSIVLGYLKDNPLIRVIRPKNIIRKSEDTKDNYYDNKEELDYFLKVAKSQNIRKYTFFKLLSSTGLRRGEALALEWSDIDFSKHVIHITKTLAQGFDNKQIIQTPKTKNSLRDVPMSNKLMDDLKKYRASRKVIYPLVFCKRDGDYLNLAAPSNWLHYLYRGHPEIKQITVHGFRHTFATLMLQPGTGNTPKDVQMILGHENIDMTLNIYTHESKKGKNNIIKSINSIGF
ncbi:MAG: site-specific integrase [Lactobacillus sp.]|nr:site-specific integrase [Lactobacillus sp.]